MNNSLIEVVIEKLVFGGTALGRDESGLIYFVWNALPGEKVLVRVTKKKNKYIEAIAEQIISPSPHRIAPLESHYLSSSPWGIMDLATENLAKVAIAREIFKKNGNIDLSSDLNIYTDGRDYGYRNKIEFSFTENIDREITLAFFTRGNKTKIPVSISNLADDTINIVADKIIRWLNDSPLTNDNLKSLIIRSNGNGEAIAGLFIKNETELEIFPSLDENLIGFQIFYSTHKSPVSVPTKLLHSSGSNNLSVELQENKLQFGLFSFFQVNIPVFAEALSEIYKYIPNNSSVLDLYAGVGSIGLSVAEKSRDCLLVESNTEAVSFANLNIERNNLKNCSTLSATSEQALDTITSDKIVIVDPPRAGLHPDIVERLLEIKPSRIIYLSCGLDTQARDISKLLNSYKIIHTSLYNFFPRTPHIESLIVLDI